MTTWWGRPVPPHGPPWRTVRLRCGRCRRILDRVEERLSGWILGGREHDMIFDRTTGPQAAYRCKRGHECQVSTDRVAELAPLAAELGADLLAGLPRYGLPPC